jgi:hypothetical protein
MRDSHIQKYLRTSNGDGCGKELLEAMVSVKQPIACCRGKSTMFFVKAVGLLLNVAQSEFPLPRLNTAQNAFEIRYSTPGSYGSATGGIRTRFA